jgi:hypothetical protein
MKFIRLFIIFILVNTCIYAQEAVSYHVSSPDGKIFLTSNPTQGTYSITRSKKQSYKTLNSALSEKMKTLQGH